MNQDKRGQEKKVMTAVTVAVFLESLHICRIGKRGEEGDDEKSPITTLI